MAARSGSYVVGIDIGTTYTAAAVHTLGGTDGSDGAGGRWHMADLGTRSTTIPSIVLLREDGTTLVGEAADRRALLEPTRVAREFKRRLGDSVPMLLGGTPLSAEQLTAKVLRYVLDQVAEVEGGPAAAIALTHPANWGAFKIDVLRAAVELAGENPRRVIYLSEPEAAALAYAAHDRPPSGARVAVYDLGGGTFDVAILQDQGERYALIGEPGGVERLGGIDFDEALFRHVLSMVDGAEELDATDPPIMADLVALRTSCIAAKEALSEETDTEIVVRLGSIRSEIRVVRSEFEALIRPTLEYTTAALARTLEESGLTPEDLHAVLLVGGSSRIPLVSQLVSGTIGRPVALDIHPKHAVALGASLVAAGTAPGDVNRQDAPLVVINHAGDEQTDPYAALAEATSPDAQRADVVADTPTGLELVEPPEADPYTGTDADAEATPPIPDTGAAAPEPRQRSPWEAPDPGSDTTTAQAESQQPRTAEQAAGHGVESTSIRRSEAEHDGAGHPQRRSEHRDIAAHDHTEIDDRENAFITPPDPPQPRRWVIGVALGAFIGFVALVGLLIVRDRYGNSGDPPFTPGTVVTETVSTALPVDPGQLATDELIRYLDRVNSSEVSLSEIGISGDRVVEQCRRFLREVEESYGPIPASPPVIPPTLEANLDASSAPAAYLDIVAQIIDVDLRRYQACEARDRDTYDLLQAEGNNLRGQLESARSS